MAALWASRRQALATAEQAKKYSNHRTDNGNDEVADELRDQLHCKFPARRFVFESRENQKPASHWQHYEADDSEFMVTKYDGRHAENHDEKTNSQKHQSSADLKEPPDRTDQPRGQSVMLRFLIGFDSRPVFVVIIGHKCR